jgi:hypothetical protein
MAHLGMVDPQKVEHAAELILIVDQRLRGNFVLEPLLKRQSVNRDCDRRE